MPEEAEGLTSWASTDSTPIRSRPIAERPPWLYVLTEADEHCSRSVRGIKPRATRYVEGTQALDQEIETDDGGGRRQERDVIVALVCGTM